MKTIFFNISIAEIKKMFFANIFKSYCEKKSLDCLALGTNNKYLFLIEYFHKLLYNKKLSYILTLQIIEIFFY